MALGQSSNHRGNVMKTIQYSLLVFGLALSSTLMAADVSRTMFLMFMRQQAPQSLCGNTDLLACTDVTYDQCMAELNKVNGECTMEAHQVWPEHFSETQESALKYGGWYSRCLLKKWQEMEVVGSDKLDSCVTWE